MFNNLNHHFHKGVGSAGEYGNLPNQMIPQSKKTPDFERNTLDALESIALLQVQQNADFTDYYDMVEGRLVAKDFMEDSDYSSLQGIGKIMKDVELPTYIQHYDILGMIVNQLVGELPNMTDVVRVISDDDYAKNDFIREKEQRIQEYVKSSFSNNLNRLLALKGINPIKDDFETQEEQQEYLQFLEQEKAKIISPQEIEKQMSKSWKVRAVEWAEKKYEQDAIDFNMEDMEKEEMKDYLLTGRYFTHYRIGYDSYKPERWDPRLVFFSQNIEIKNPQDGEFVGRIFPMTASQIVENYGHKMSVKTIDEISKVYDNYREGRGTSVGNSPFQKPVQITTVPDEDYFNREIYLQYQSAYGIPLGEEVSYNEDGTQTITPTWISDYNNSNSFTAINLGRELRKDIRVNTNTFRVTESYFRGYKLYYAIRYEAEEGYIIEDLVEEDLLKGFIKENNIKIKRSMTLQEFETSDEVNIICPTYFPRVYSGIKIAGSSRTEDIYLPIEELPFQIKGNSEVYDVKLPVAGIIESSLAQKIRPFQKGHNIALNQITHLIEKELGSFFLVDIGLLPSDMKEGNTNEQLAELRDTIRDIGIFPIDMRKQNTQQAGNTSNTFVQQRLTFTEEISSRIQLANFYKQQAYEQIGITEQRKGTPNEYQTNEGIKVGQEASFAQTASIFTKFNNSRKRKIELHLAVAQYCVQNDKDITTFYTNTDNDKIFQNFSDDKFHLRRLGVRPTSNTKNKKELETLKNIMLNNNTSGFDVLALGEIAKSDSFTSLIEFGKNERVRLERLESEKRQFESEQLNKQIESERQAVLETRVFEKLIEDNKNKTRIQEENISALGRAADKQSDQSGFNEIKMATESALKEQDIQSRNQVENRKLDIKEKEGSEDMAYKMAQLNKELKALNFKNKELEAKKYIATINKN